MKIDNYFDKTGQPLEQKSGKDITNLRTRDITRVNLPDGSFKEFIPEDNFAVPDGIGGYIDGKIRNIYINETGDSLGEDLNNLCETITGNLVPSKYVSKCSSSFHPSKRPRNLVIGIDGSSIENGAICYICRRRRAFFRFLLLLPFIGLILGVFIGVARF